MKNSLVKLSIIYLILFVSCNKHEKITPENLGSSDVMLNEKKLDKFFNKGISSITAYERIDSCGQFVSIGLTTQTKKFQNSLTLLFENIPKIPGVYPIDQQMTDCQKLGTTNGIAHVIADYDLLGNRYKVLPSPNNYLEIKSLDQEKREVSGSFTVTMVVDLKINTDWVFPFPDTLRYVGKSFHTKYE